MPCASRGRTSCCRFGSHPQGPALGDSFLQERARAGRWRVWLAVEGGGHSGKSLRTESRAPDRMFAHRLCAYPGKAYPSRVFAQPKGPSLEDLPFPKHLVKSPDINLQESRQYPKAHSRRLVGLCCCWLQGQLASCAPSRLR